ERGPPPPAAQRDGIERSSQAACRATDPPVPRHVRASAVADPTRAGDGEHVASRIDRTRNAEQGTAGSPVIHQPTSRFAIVLAAATAAASLMRPLSPAAQTPATARQPPSPPAQSPAPARQPPSPAAQSPATARQPPSPAAQSPATARQGGTDQSPSGSQTPAQPRSQQPPFRAGIELVSLNVTVTDGTQKYITDLSADDFSVFEDGVKQDVTFFNRTNLPLALALLLDTSASMETKLPTA